MLLRSSLPTFVLLFAACAGGGGSYSGDYQDTYDRAPATSDSAIKKTTERTKLLNETIASSNEASGGSGSASGVGGFNCLGTFKCSAATNITGTSKSSTTLSLPGVCNYQGSGFNPDGTLTSNGQVIGTWSVTSTGFAITESVTVRSGKNTSTVTVTLDCTKISDAYDPKAIGTGDDDDDIQAPPQESSSGTTIVIDAGVRK